MVDTEKAEEIIIDVASLYESLVNDKVAKQLKEIRKELGKQQISIMKHVDVMVDGHSISVIAPNYNEEECDPEACSYAMDRYTYELLLNLSEGWARTGYIVRFNK